ncbi:MAG: hypothetical protein JXR40_05290, partial [Pontiellaceae bacterium]|nr:hypothetical protein [Pontiellaceae bacterium]
MTWWKKGLLWSVASVGLIIAVGITFDDALPNDGVSTICGSLSGVVLVLVWVVAFMRRSGSASETDTRDYGPEKTILSARACNYLKN